MENLEGGNGRDINQLYYNLQNLNNNKNKKGKKEKINKWKGGISFVLP